LKVLVGKMAWSWWSWGQMRTASEVMKASTPSVTTMTTSVATPLRGRNSDSRMMPIRGATTRNNTGMAIQAEMPHWSWSCQYA
jgi:hypothetical protein